MRGLLLAAAGEGLGIGTLADHDALGAPGEAELLERAEQILADDVVLALALELGIQHLNQVLGLLQHVRAATAERAEAVVQAPNMLAHKLVVRHHQPNQAILILVGEIQSKQYS